MAWPATDDLIAYDLDATRDGRCETLARIEQVSQA